jgi:hypothetical protein
MPDVTSGATGNAASYPGFLFRGVFSVFSSVFVGLSSDIGRID